MLQSSERQTILDVGERASRARDRQCPSPLLERRIRQRSFMSKMVITHKVEDVEKWLKGKVERAEAIAHLGGKNVVDHVASDGSNNVAVTADVSDPAALTAALASPSPELSTAMASHGVVPPLTLHVEK